MKRYWLDRFLTCLNFLEMLGDSSSALTFLAECLSLLNKRTATRVFCRVLSKVKAMSLPCWMFRMARLLRKNGKTSPDQGGLLLLCARCLLGTVMWTWIALACLPFLNTQGAANSARLSLGNTGKIDQIFYDKSDLHNRVTKIILGVGDYNARPTH